MDTFSDILDFLNKLENSIKCPLCSNKCLEPVRIKTCGHYFCNECLKSSKENHNCPRCNEFYELKHLDYENIAKASQQQLADLRQLLESAQGTSVLEKDNIALSNAAGAEVLTENTISYDHVLYHINFTNTNSKINSKGETTLHLACKKNKFNEVKTLVESKVDINAKDYAGWAPLHEAVQSQSLKVIEYLLQNNCLIDIPGADYVTPLHQAASLDSIEMVTLLLKYGADKNMVDYTGLKPEDCSKNQSLKAILKAHSASAFDRKLFEVFLPGQISLYCHSINEDIKNKLDHCKNIQVVNKMEVKKKLTHIVVKETHKMSFKIMQAMLEGLQFLTEESVDNYINGNYFINIPKYVFLKNNKLNTGIQKAMLSTLLKLPKLFDGISFYIEDHTSAVDVYHLKVDKEYISKLIKAGGGRVLHRPPATRTCESEYSHPFFSQIGSATYSCCNFILFDEKHPPDLLYNMKELQHKSSRWLIDCVTRYEICD